MRVDNLTNGGILHVRLDGVECLESANAATVKQAVVGRIDGSCDVVIDLSGVAFIDSAGVASLVSMFKAARLLGKQLRFARVSPEVASVLRLVKLDQIFEIHPDVESAARSLRGRVVEFGGGRSGA